MYKSAKSRAEEKFTSSQKKTEQFLEDRKKAEQERADRVATLRAQRLAKEASDAVIAEAVAKQAEKDKLAAKAKKTKKPTPMPQAHRHN